MPTTQCVTCQPAEFPAPRASANQVEKGEADQTAGFQQALTSASGEEPPKESGEPVEQKQEDAAAFVTAQPASEAPKNPLPFTLSFSLTGMIRSEPVDGTESTLVPPGPRDTADLALPTVVTNQAWGSGIFSGDEPAAAEAAGLRLGAGWEKVSETNAADTAKPIAAVAGAKLAFGLNLTAREAAAPQGEAPTPAKPTAPAVISQPVVAETAAIGEASTAGQGQTGDQLNHPWRGESAPQGPNTAATAFANVALNETSQTARGGEAVATQRTAQIDLPADTNPTQTVAREISWNLRGPDNQNAHVRMVDRAGEVQVTVRTSTQELVQPLRAELQTLVHRLQGDGFQVQAFQPSAETANNGNETRRDGQSPAGRDTNQQQQHAGGGDRRDHWRRAFDQAGDAELSSWS